MSRTSRIKRAGGKRARTPRVPLVSSQQAVAALRRLNFIDMPATGSSHHTMWRPRLDGTKDVTVIVLGKKEIPRETLRSALKLGNVSIEDFIEALRR